MRVLMWSTLLLALASGSARAQTPAPQASPFNAGWRDGFILQSDNGDFRLQLGLFVHADARVAIDDETAAVTNTFLLRRLRPNFRVRLHNRFELYFNPDFAGGSLAVQDAYVDTRFSDAFRLRLGKSKTPFGLERSQSASNVLFSERALPSALAPNRDVGIQILGDVAGGMLTYGVGLLNGVADGGSADTDVNDSKDIAARVMTKPFARHAGSPMTGLSVGIAGSTGTSLGAAGLPSLRTTSVQQTFFTYAGASADGRRTRISPQASYYFKSFGGFGEYVRTELPVLKAGARSDIRHEAWQAAASWLLTGENATDGAVRPRSNFNFGGGQIGALQIAARYHALEIDEAAITLGFAAPGASRKAEAWTVGLNWFLTPNLKYVFNYERTVFDGDADGARKAEDALVFRSQINF
jgi:phosphate-selective porin OprO and OprP